MSKCLWMFLTAIFLLGGLADDARSAQQAKTFTVSPMIGGYLFEGNQDLDNDFTYGLGFGYNYTRQLGVELFFNNVHPDGEDGGPDADVATFRVDALYHLMADQPLVPYLAAGLGVQFLDFDLGDSDNEALFNYGGGLKLDIARNTALRADVRHIVTGERASNLIYTAGLVYQFGGPREEPRVEPVAEVKAEPKVEPKPEPKVEPQVVPVAPVPAPAPEPAPPVVADSDGDGVPDSRDQCPGTSRGIIVDEQGCPLQLTLRLNFDFDKAEIKPEHKPELEKAAAFIRQYPDVPYILVAGHTDALGSDDYNQKLSERRAQAVVNYLVTNLGIDAKRITARGYGEARPVADNATKEGQALNRRVEVICCAILPD